MDAVATILRAIIRAAAQPPASWLGLIGLLVVAAVLIVPPLAPFATGWHILAGIALVAWLAMAATQVEPAVYRRLQYRLVGHDPYLVRVLERRDALAAELEHMTMSGLRADVTLMIQDIDHHLLPELATRVRRHRALVRGLEQFARGEGPLVGASPENIAALRRLAQEQQQALDGLVARLSDMNANLIGLIQEADQSALLDETREWVRDLGAYWQATAEVFRATDLAARGRGP